MSGRTMCWLNLFFQSNQAKFWGSGALSDEESGIGAQGVEKGERRRMHRTRQWSVWQHVEDGRGKLVETDSSGGGLVVIEGVGDH